MQGSCSDPLEKWKLENPDLAEFISVKESDRTPTELAQFRTHQLQFLRTHRTNLSQELRSLAAKLDESANPPPSESAFLGYDFQNENMNVRKLCAVKKMIQQRRNRVFTELYGITRSSVDRIGRVLRILESVPAGCELAIAPKLFSSAANEKMIKAEREIKMLSAHEKLLQERISSYVIPAWKVDFPQFLESMVLSSFRNFMPDLSYIPPQESEVSLSRCFFERGSRFLAEIDKTLATYSQVGQAEFVKRVLALCYSLMPKNLHVEPAYAPLVLLFIYRAVFNRFYEKYEHVFVWKDTQTCAKVGKLANLASTCFSIPAGMADRPRHDVTISQLFIRGHRYDKAMEMLEDTFFVTTPLDALFKLHQSIIAIQRAALNFDEEKGNLHEVMSFDDLFSLLFGVFLGSQVPDLLYLEWFVMTFAPIQSLSPPLEYALANMEALCKHLKAVSIVTKRPH